MGSRRFDLADRLLGEIDNIIKTLTVPARGLRAIPAVPAAGSLPAAERASSVRLMRVNHSGEVAAQALYRGQGVTARDAGVRAAMREAAAEEVDHLAWCGQR